VSMAIKDLHVLPRVEDGWSFLYVEHCRVEQDGKSIAIWEGSSVTPVPCAVLSLLILGPGTAITHAAVRTLVESGCLIQWSGEESVRVYGLGLGETRSSRNLLRQARAWADPRCRLQVVRRLYAKRFGEAVDESLTLQQLRGREGIRVRNAYAEASRTTGVELKGRNYDRANWRDADPREPGPFVCEQLPVRDLSCGDRGGRIFASDRIHSYGQSLVVRL